MKILINLSIIKFGGTLQVALSLIDELKTNPHNHTYLFLLSKELHALIRQPDFPANFSFIRIDPHPSDIVKGWKSRKQLKTFEDSFQPDVVFTLFGPSYWKPKAPHLCGYALPHFIYPESPFFKLISIKEKIKWRIIGYLKFISFKKDCDYYVTETEDVSSRLAKKLHIPESKVFTVHNSYNGIFDSPHKWIDMSTRTVAAKGFKLITISSYYPHKNLNIIPGVISYIKTVYPGFEFTFILTIKEEQLPNLNEDHKKHILFMGKVSMEECPGLYQQADALFMPSLLECFTVSYLEAMKMGKPILTSDLPFAHDICREAAIYFRPLSPESIAENIVALASDKKLQNDLIDKGRARLKLFDKASDRAQNYLKILERISGS